MDSTINTTNYPIFKPWEKYLALFFIAITGLYSWYTAKVVNFHAEEARNDKAAEIKDAAKAHQTLMQVFKEASKKFTKTTNDGLNSLWWLQIALAIVGALYLLALKNSK